MFDRDMRYLAASSRWLHDYGLAGRAFLGQSQYDLFPDLPERWKSIHQRCLLGEEAHAEEDPFTSADGATQWVRWAIQPWRAAAGTVGGLVIFAEDISPRKEFESQLRDSEAKLGAELDAMRRLQALAARSVTEADLDAVLGDVMETALAITHADCGLIQLLDERSGNLTIATHRGLPARWIDYWQSAASGQGACGTALETKARVIVEDVLDNPIVEGAAREMHQRAGIRAVQSTPLVSRAGRVLGVFSTQWRVPRRPGEDELRLLDILARQTADTIDTFRATSALASSEANRAFDEASLRAAIDAMTDSVIITNRAGRVLMINEAFASAHRFPSKAACLDTLGQYSALFDVFLPSGERAEPTQWASARALRGETAIDQEYHVQRRDTG
jgi:PAS domain S-box-containing protein